MIAIRSLIVTTAAVIGINASATAQAARATVLVDPNTATVQQLTALPGMNPAHVRTVVAGRPYATASSFDAVLVKAGLTDEQRVALYRKAFVRIDVNTATDADILLIPGIGKKMLHEFKEYRPYKAMAQFRREIGKYVDAEEVARLESYLRPIQ